MIVLSNSATQTLLPNQSLTFDIVRQRSGCAERFRQGSSGVRVQGGNSLYEVEFNANISGAVAATAVQLSIKVDGETLPETTVISTPAAINTLNNVSAGTAFRSCGSCSVVTVTNTGSTNVIVNAGTTSLKISRKA